MYEGKSCECTVTGLKPFTEYTVYVVAFTEQDRSPASESTTFVTLESGDYS